VSDQPHQTGSTYVAAALILAVTLPLFLPGLGDRHIWTPLEARYALVAREMLAGGHWILPHLGGEVYPDKPPLLFWSIGLISVLGSGVSEWTARLPTALAAIGSCLMTWRLGTRLFSSTAGTTAALVLATSGGFFWSGRQALPDMLLTLWTTGAAWALWEWVAAGRRSAAIVAGVCMGLATLTKGPVGLVLPALSALLYLSVRRLWPMLRGWDALLCFGAFLGVTLTWFLAAVAQGGLEYARATLLHHSLERYARAWEHTAPWFFYLGAFPAEFLPWTLVLPYALASGAKLRRSPARAGWCFALCWLVTILVFFSISTGKRDIYMLPAFPAAALLVGWSWSHWWDSAPEDVSGWPLRLAAIVLALSCWGLAGGIWGAVDGLLPSKSTLLLPGTAEMRLWACLLLILAGILLGSAALAPWPRLVYASIAGCTWLAMLASTVWVYTPQFNQRYSIKSFAAAIEAHIRPDKPLRLCGPMNDLGLRFNLGRFVPALYEPPEILRYLGAEREVFCVIEAEGYQRFRELAGQTFPIVARQDIDRSTLLLISNRW
jgi:hypothetical protein